MASMARKVDPREAAAKKTAEEATKKALADKKAREAADKKAAEMAAALKATQEKEAKEVPPYLNIFVPHLRPVSKPSVSGLVFFPFFGSGSGFFLSPDPDRPKIRNRSGKIRIRERNVLKLELKLKKMLYLIFSTFNTVCLGKAPTKPYQNLITTII